MTLINELQINIVMSNYNPRSGGYSSNYDYLFLDNLSGSSYSNLFRSDLKNLKIKDVSGNNLKVLYIPEYGSQPSAILVKIPVGRISESTKLILEVYDKSTTFSSTLSTGDEVLMFDANNDTYSNFFMNYSGLSINDDSIDGGKFLRAKYVTSVDGSSPSSLFTNFVSGQNLNDNRVTVARFKRIKGNVTINDNATYLGTTSGSVMIQNDYNLTMYQIDRQVTSLSIGGSDKSYCMFNGTQTVVLVSSFDSYNHGSDDGGNWNQYHIHGRVGIGTSIDSDYIEGFYRNNPTKIYEDEYNEIEISPSWYSTTDFDEFNYVDLKWLLVFPSPLFANNGISTITITEKTVKSGIRLFKGEYEYSKAYKGSVLLWDANDEAMDNTGLYIPDKIKNKEWDWVF